MGERKGVNKYYPPDYDPSRGGLNKFQGTHALRERARKLHLGILIIRFEMPYNIWCEGCENHIGTGVRYNAEKKKVGMYYSTPIYQFRMKCHLCDNHFEIKTDPANLDYEIVSGARRQERRWDPTENEQIVPEDKDVTRKMATDAMFKLEHGVGDKQKSKEVDATLQVLEEFQAERWHDDYGSNKMLRAAMRVKRDEAKVQAKKDASYHLDVPLLPPSEDDAKTAKLLQFTQSKSSDELRNEKRAVIDAQSVFARLKTKRLSASAKKAIAQESIKHIITNSQKSFSNYKNTFGQQNLGIVYKKSPSEIVADKNKKNIKVEASSSTSSSPTECSSTTTEPDMPHCSSLRSDIPAESFQVQKLSPSGCKQSESKEFSPVIEKSLSNTTTSLVGYDLSASDSD